MDYLRDDWWNKMKLLSDSDQSYQLGGRRDGMFVEVGDKEIESACRLIGIIRENVVASFRKVNEREMVYNVNDMQDKLIQLFLGFVSLSSISTGNDTVV